MYSVLTSSVSAEDAEALGEKEQLTLSKFLGKESEAQRDKVSDMPKATASGSVIKVSKLYFQCSFHSSMLLLPPLKKKSHLCIMLCPRNLIWEEGCLPGDGAY